MPPVGSESIASCSGCGACCLEQGAPPDFVALALNPHFFEDPSFADDVTYWNAMPTEARILLEDYLRRSAAGEIPRNGPCVWYAPENTACRFYDVRPSTCRVFERGSPGCHIYRSRWLVNLDEGQTANESGQD